MSVVQTVLVFVGIPALVFGLVGVLVLAPGAARTPRYRPGEAWDHEPVWYVPQPKRVRTPSAGSGYAALERGHSTPALTGSDAGSDPGPDAGSDAPDTPPPAPARTARGGVHDTW